MSMTHAITVQFPSGPVAVTADPIPGTHFAIAPVLARRTEDGPGGPLHFTGGWGLIHQPSGLAMPDGGATGDLDGADAIGVLCHIARVLEATGDVDWASASPSATPEAVEAVRAALIGALGTYEDRS